VRCRASAVLNGLLCNAHSGRLDARAGGKARAQKIQQQREAVQQRVALSRLGTRAVVAQALLEKHEQVAAAVRLLADDAADERAPHAQRLKSAQALIPWLDQALGKPTERVDVKAPSTLEDLEQMDTAQLLALVAEGRERRLQLVKEAEEQQPELAAPRPTPASLAAPE
jgi:hypothetical protein